MIERLAAEPTLPTAWFLIIAVLWIGYLVLDGFDLGVGMLMSRIFSRTEKERRVLLNSIGPVWDGNEVWLVTAVAAMFAAFPHWYASLLSAVYIPVTLLLLALITRAVSIEYRGKGHSERWIRNWTVLMTASSLAIAFLIGVILASTTTGLPINGHGDRVGGPWHWISLPALLGGLAVVGFALIHGLAFIALKTDGPVRHRARKALLYWLPLGLLPMIGWIVLLQQRSGNPFSWALAGLAISAGVVVWAAIRRGHEGIGFSGMVAVMLFGLLSIFAALFPEVLPTTLPDGIGLTIDTASSSQYTLTVVSIVSAFGIPVLLLYQGWTYWVFRQRLSTSNIPEAHSVSDLSRLPNRS